MRKSVALFAALCAFLLAITISPAAAQDGRITLIHGIPGVDVDVEINGDIAVDEFSFGDRQDLSALSGETLDTLRLLGAGTDSSVFDMTDLALPDADNYTFIAHLDEDGQPIVTRFKNDTRPISAGSGRLTVRHAAGAGPVNVTLDGGTIIQNLSNAREGGADIDTGDFEIAVALVGEDDPIIGPAAISVVEGESIVVYAVGAGADATVLTEMVSFGPAEDADTGDDDADEMTEDEDAAGDDDAEAMTDEDDDDEDTAMNSAPTGVETGNSPITSQSFPLMAFAIGVIAICSAGTFGLRRFDANR